MFEFASNVVTVCDMSTTSATEQAIADLVQQEGHLIAETLNDTSSSMLKEHRELNEELEERLYEVWGPALDYLYEAHVLVEEVGRMLQSDRELDLTGRVLIDINGQVALVLAEVHNSLKGGFPVCGLSRCRTLVELVTVASVLARHGRDSKASDLAQRYVDHGVIDLSKDLRSARDSGIEVEEAYFDAVMARRSEVIARYGKSFKYDHAWAAPLFHHDRPEFKDLASFADTGLRPSDYRFGHRPIHASAHSLEMTIVGFRGTAMRLTSSTNAGLEEPGALALRCAISIMCSLLVHGATEPEVADLPQLVAVTERMQRGVDAFFESADLLARMEQDVIAELQTEL